MKLETKRTTMHKNQGIISMIIRDLSINRWIYFMLIPVLAFYIIFHYAPMYGAVVAFKNYRPFLGISGSEWVGFRYFIEFFESPYFVRTVRNTIIINIYQLIFQFPAPIILAILINEVKNSKFKKTVQTITYLPHFLSLVVICGLIIQATSSSGFITQVVNLFVPVSRGGLISNPNYFRTIYVSSGIWQSVGWGSIIYLAAISSVDVELYESAYMDGANKLRMIWHITIPCILPTIVILLILNIGGMMSVGWEKIFLLYSPLTYETADVISTYVYRKGISEMNFSFATAVGLFNSVVNFILIISANTLSRKFNETSLW